MSIYSRPSFREWLDLLAYDDPLGAVVEFVRGDTCPGANARHTYYQLRRHFRNHHDPNTFWQPQLLAGLTDALERFKAFKEVQHIIASGRGWLLATDTPEMVEASLWASKVFDEDLRAAGLKKPWQPGEGRSSRSAKASK